MKKFNLIGIATLIIGASFMYPEKVFSHSQESKSSVYWMNCPDGRWKHPNGRNGHKHVCIGTNTRKGSYYYCTECQKQ